MEPPQPPQPPFNESRFGDVREPPEALTLFAGEDFYDGFGLANDPDVEEFAELASEGLGASSCVVTLLPWRNHIPKGVLAPELDSADFLLSETEIAQAVAKASSILIPCTLELEEEHEQAKRIVPQFRQCENVCIIAVLLLPKVAQLQKETNQLLLRRQTQLLTAGVDDVLFEQLGFARLLIRWTRFVWFCIFSLLYRLFLKLFFLCLVILKPRQEWDLASLKRAINLSRAMWEVNVLRTRLMLNAEIDYDVAEEASRCQEEHSELFFQQIPEALMPEFRPMDRQILETGNSVGNFRLVCRLPSKTGTVLQAADEEQQAVAIKVFNKSQVMDPGLPLVLLPI